MNQDLIALLEHLLDVLDADRQAEIENLHKRALNWQPVERLPLVMCYPPSEELPVAPYPHSETFRDPKRMLFNEMVYAFNTSIASRGELNDDLTCTIRANFGTIIIASMFGARVEQVDDNPPWVLHDSNRDTSLEGILEHDPLDFSRGVKQTPHGRTIEFT